MAETAYRARESFMYTQDGMPRVIRAGDIVAADDPALRAAAALFQPMSEWIEQTTNAPGEIRPVRLPSGVTAQEAIKPRDDRNRRGVKGAQTMPHMLPPEDPDSPASTFAPFQPAAGVVADDVVEKGQATESSTSASEATEIYAGQTPDTGGGHTGEAPAEMLDANAATTDEDADLSAYAKGGGWYEVNGETVQGKEAARELLGRQG